MSSRTLPVQRYGEVLQQQALLVAYTPRKCALLKVYVYMYIQVYIYVIYI